jgi:hypothetical protein
METRWKTTKRQMEKVWPLKGFMIYLGSHKTHGFGHGKLEEERKIPCDERQRLGRRG